MSVDRSTRTLRVEVPTPTTGSASYADVEFVAGAGVTMTTVVTNGRAVVTFEASGGGGGVTSVNGDVGPAVVLDAVDVGADPAGTAAGLVATEASSRATADALLTPMTRTIATTAPLTGGGDLSANRTIAIPAATSLVDGFLAAVDWVTFNAKQAASSVLATLVSNGAPGVAGLAVLLKATAGDIRTYLSLVIGTNVQAWDADLDAVAANATNGMLARTGAGTVASRTFGAGSAQLVVTNGDGVAGAPSYDLAYASNLRETGGPTTLALGAAADGSLLKRSGSTLVGVTAIVDSTTRTVGTPLDSTDPRNFEPAFGYRHGYCVVDPGGGTPRPVGCVVTTRGNATDGSDATAPYTTYTSAVSANAAAGWWIPLIVQSRHGAFVRFVIKTPATITNYRVFIGLQSAETPTDGGAAHQAVLRYSTTAGDTTFMLVTKDGTTQTTQADAAIAASTRYVIDVWLTASLMTVQINGATATTKSTNLPGSSIILGVICQATADAVPTGARKVDIDRIAWCQTT